MPTHYIHGFTPQEQQRLIAQAAMLAPQVFNGLDFSNARRLLEIGCGVGAELRHIARRWPALALTGLDLSAAHLQAARRYLNASGQAVIALVRGHAERLPFAESSFDRVVTIWLLEHVATPGRVIAEALRVLRPGGSLICTEVDNQHFAFTPEQPPIMDWWRRFNAFQRAGGGHPFIGSELAALAHSQGATAIETQPIAVISSHLRPWQRTRQLEYLHQLLLSGAASMLANGYADIAMKRRLTTAFAQLRANPDVHFEYHARRLVCRA
jgi:ubiquinone/menaquinone biosynthesis C-methylase UbiE